MRHSMIVLGAMVLAVMSGTCGSEKGTDTRTTTTWEKTFGGTARERAAAIIETSDGSFVVAGPVGQTDNTDVYVVKLDLNGNMLWEQTLGGQYGDIPMALGEAHDGGVLITGRWVSYVITNDTDAFVWKTDADGEIDWEQIYGGTKDDYVNWIMRDDAGGYCLAGWTGESPKGGSGILLLSIDASGTVLEQNVVPFGSSPAACAPAPSGGIIAVMGGFDDSIERSCARILRTDASRTIVWDFQYSCAYSAISNSVTLATDGGLVIAGYARPENGIDRDGYVAKVDDAGNLLWEKIVGGDMKDEFQGVAATSDGGYILAGFTTTRIAEGTEVYLVRIDGSGNVLWERTFGGQSFDKAAAVAQTMDGGYVVAGYTGSFGEGLDDFYVIKTDENGEL